jgi:hypothetical protein
MLEGHDEGPTITPRRSSSATSVWTMFYNFCSPPLQRGRHDPPVFRRGTAVTKWRALERLHSAGHGVAVITAVSLGCLPGQAANVGGHTKQENVSHWEYVDLNQPGDPDYLPEDPWISVGREDRDGRSLVRG